ncbi:AAA family ATPase (plasmid) [Lysinibacillus sphaericus]|uniref:ATP-binding protein n=1 Tax=Lysinibacillus sphaericus TaxID=1421 RepID=UPI001E38BCF4|nr:ATP-binding protein [Lysinibacillus sphaericus]UDK94838.1 AAA family ATPase [Lysinibacillus sphaericus]
MSIDSNVKFLQTALNAGENVVITGGVGTGKTYLLQKLEEYLGQNKKVKYFTCESNSIEDVIAEVNEILKNNEDVILLIDEVNKLVNAGFSLNYINPVTRIVAAIQVFDPLKN